MDSDALTLKGVLSYLRHRELRISVFDSIASTNNALKQLAQEGEAEGRVLIASEQTAGRGSRGRSFFSPAGTGIYMSVLLRPTQKAEKAADITATAAVAAAEAIEKLSGRPAGIKWVNDIWMEGRKVSGILTEGALDPDGKHLSWAVMGIGVNANAPAGGFPPELRDTAGAVFEASELPLRRCRLAAAILDGFWARYQTLGSEETWRAYKERSLVIGQNVNILYPDREPEQAKALDILRDFSLWVRYSDGRESALRSGEVSIRACR